MMKKFKVCNVSILMAAAIMLSACGSEEGDVVTNDVETPKEESTASEIKTEMPETDVYVAAQDKSSIEESSDEPILPYNEATFAIANEIATDFCSQVEKLYVAEDYFGICDLLVSDEYGHMYDKLTELETDDFCGYYLMAQSGKYYIHFCDVGRIVVDDSLESDIEHHRGEFSAEIDSLSVSDMDFEFKTSKYYIGDIIFIDEDVSENSIVYVGHGVSGYHQGEINQDSYTQYICEGDYKNGLQDGEFTYEYTFYHPKSSIADEYGLFIYNISDGVPVIIEDSASGWLSFLGIGNVHRTQYEEEHDYESVLYISNKLGSYKVLEADNKKVGPYEPFDYFYISAYAHSKEQ